MRPAPRAASSGAFAFACAFDAAAAVLFVGALAAPSPPFAAPSMSTTPSPARLSCSLEAPATMTAGGPVPLRFVLVNEEKRPVRVLRWNTPWEGRWTAPMVTVSRDGVALPYAGPSAKRGDPSPADYLLLAPGAHEAAVVDLSLPYDLSVPGRYVVQPRLRLHDVIVEADGRASAARPRSAHQGADLPCPEAVVTVTPP